MSMRPALRVVASSRIVRMARDGIARTRKICGVVHCKHFVRDIVRRGTVRRCCSKQQRNGKCGDRNQPSHFSYPKQYVFTLLRLSARNQCGRLAKIRNRTLLTRAWRHFRYYRYKRKNRHNLNDTTSPKLLCGVRGGLKILDRKRS